jgi:stage III sporulation protein AF
MPEIAEWIKKIIAVLILAGFLEMLLPNNELKGVTKMVMGLLIILIIMQPVFKILKVPSVILLTLPAIVEVKNIKQESSSTQTIVKQGMLIRDGWITELKKRRQIIVEDKLKTSIGLIDGIKLVKMNPIFADAGSTGAEGLAGMTGMTGIIEIKLKVRLTGIKEKPRFSFKETAAQQKIYDRRIRESIQLCCDLPDDRIEVTWDD